MIVISEAAPIDAVVQLSRAWPDLPADERHATSGRDGRRLRPQARRRRAPLPHQAGQLAHAGAAVVPARLSDVPWVFLYRDPVEVLVSQMRQRGTQMVPDIVPPSLYGIDGSDGMPGEDYCARVLATMCAAVIDHLGDGGGLLVNYRELPAAVWTRILPHFGMACGDRERAARSSGHAQRREDAELRIFRRHGGQARRGDGRLRALAEQHLGDVYRRLEELRAGS